MKNVISIASTVPEYDTSSIVMHLVERLTRDNPNKRILAIGQCTPEALKKVELEAVLDTEALRPDEVERIVKNYANDRDLVICSAGGSLENASSLGCLFASDHTYYVFDHTEESLKRFVWFEPLLNKLGIYTDGFILDHMHKTPQYNIAKYLQTMNRNCIDRTYIMNDFRQLDDIQILATTISMRQFERSRSDDFEDRGDI